MIGIFAVHVLVLLLAIAIGVRVVPESLIADTVGYLHKAIGITTPAASQVRTVALIWIGVVLFTVDGIVLLFVFLVSHAHVG